MVSYVTCSRVIRTLPGNYWDIKSRRTRWAECVAHIGEAGNVNRILVGKPAGNRGI
jgi:hypothetical protein